MNNNINGILNLNKPINKSSHDMIYFARRIFNIKKVGHAGTLDPLATGVLPILIGSATKLSDLLLNHDKKYRAVIRLGIETDTLDISGKILKENKNFNVDYNKIKEVCNYFVGEINQVPPIYSAIKLNGRKLYEIARAGNSENLELEARKINIYSLDCEQSENINEYILNVSCSKGTYVRALCRDIGEMLGCGAVMSGLIRTQSGLFKLEESYNQEYILNCAEPENLLISCEKIANNFAKEKIYLSEFYARLARNGAEIYLNKIDVSFDYDNNYIGERIMMYDEFNNFFAIGIIREFENGLACKPEMFL